MRTKGEVNSTVICLVLILSFSLCSTASDVLEPAKGKYDLKEIKMNNYEIPVSWAEWLVTSDKESLFFTIEEPSDGSSESLVSYKLLPNAKTSSQFIWLNHKSDIEAVEALWLDDEGSVTGAGKKSGGLLIAAFTSGETNNRGGELNIATAKFDSNGKKVGGWNILQKSELDKNQYITNCRARACRVGDKIGLAVSAVFREDSSALWGVKESGLVFYELDLDGKMVGESTLLPQPKKGVQQYARVRDITWNETRWLVALSNTKYKKHWIYAYWGTTPIDNEVRIIAVWGDSSSRKAKSYKIENDKQPYGYYFNLHLLPIPSSAQPGILSSKAKGESKYLFFVHEEEIPYHEVQLDPFRFEGGIYQVDWRGKRKGSKRTVKLPKPEHSFTYDPFKKVWITARAYSNLIPMSPNQSQSAHPSATNGKYYMAGTASQSYGGSPPGDFEQRLYLYSLDIEKGKIKTLIETDDLSLENIMFLGSSIRWFNNQLSAINSYLDIGKSPSVFKSFFSVLEP